MLPFVSLKVCLVIGLVCVYFKLVVPLSCDTARDIDLSERYADHMKFKQKNNYKKDGQIQLSKQREQKKPLSFSANSLSLSSFPHIPGRARVSCIC